MVPSIKVHTHKYTNTQVHTHTHTHTHTHILSNIGQVTKGLDSVFLDQVSEVAWHDSHPSKKWLLEKEVKEYVDEHKNDHLFDFVPGREHRGYQGFQFNLKVSNPARF